MMTNPLLNPYIKLTTTFDPENFFGPLEVVRYILETISTSRTIGPIELFALPGMGKSTLLRYIADPKGAFTKNFHWLEPPFDEKPHLLFPVLIEFRLKPNDQHPFAYLFECFTGALAEYQERASVDLPDVSDVLDTTHHKAERAIGALKEQSTMLVKRGIRPVFLLDDFDLIFRELSPLDAANLRPLRDFAGLVMAIEQPLHLINKEVAGSPLFQNTPLRRMEGLPLDEARELIETPAKREKIPFPSKDVDLILEYAYSHPYLIVLACSDLWDIRKKLGILDKDTPLNQQQQALLQGYLVQDFAPSFARYWKTLTIDEQTTLKQLQTGLTTKNWNRQQLGYVSNLLNLGLVKYNSAGSEYEIFSPLFADYVLTTHVRSVDVVESNLTGFEVTLLDYLRQHANRVCTYDELWQHVWNQSIDDINLRRIQVSISRLRQKIQPNEDIMSVRDQGYKLV